MVIDWLSTGMFGDVEDAENKARRIVEKLQNHDEQRTHEKHINIDECKQMGLNVLGIEEDDKLQDLILTVHHAYIHSLTNTTMMKIIENHLGQAMCLVQN